VKKKGKKERMVISYNRNSSRMAEYGISKVEGRVNYDAVHTKAYHDT
jgi:hypothetical protein